MIHREVGPTSAEKNEIHVVHILRASPDVVPVFGRTAPVVFSLHLEVRVGEFELRNQLAHPFKKLGHGNQHGFRSSSGQSVFVRKKSSPLAGGTQRRRCTDFK